MSEGMPEMSRGTSRRGIFKKMFYYTTGSTVGGHDSKSFINLYFYLISLCPAQPSKRWLLFENMASVPSESVKRSLSLSLVSLPSLPHSERFGRHF